MSRGATLTVAVLALAFFADDATAQHRTTGTWRPPTATWQPAATTWQRPSIWQRPNPQANRPMGVPASVQPSGQPLPAPPGCWYPCRLPGVAPVYFYPVPYAYPTTYNWYAYDPRGQTPVAITSGHPQTRRPPVMTVVEPAASPRVEVGRFAPDRAAGCAVVEIRMAGGPWRNPVPLPSLGAATRDALFRALAERIAGGHQISLVTLNGTRVVLAGGAGFSGLSVEPCDGAQSPASGGAER